MHFINLIIYFALVYLLIKNSNKPFLSAINLTKANIFTIVVPIFMIGFNALLISLKIHAYLEIAFWIAFLLIARALKPRRNLTFFERMNSNFRQNENYRRNSNKR